MQTNKELKELASKQEILAHGLNLAWAPFLGFCNY